MKADLTKIYEGADLTGARSDVIYLPILRDCTLEGIDILTDAPAVGDVVFTVDLNGEILSGESLAFEEDEQLTIANGERIVSVGGLSVALSKGDEITLNLVSGSVSSPLTLNLATDDGADSAETTATIGTLISGATGKSTPVDADLLPLSDSADSGIVKKLTWLNIKVALKAVFDSIYVTGPLSVTDNTIVLFDGTSGELIKDSAKTLSTDGTFASNSDAKIPTEKAVKTYVAANASSPTAATIGTLIASATSKTTPVDADSIGLSDSAASDGLKKMTWANLKAALKTYFDTLYQAVLVSGTSIKTVNGSSLLGSGNLTISGGGGSVPSDFISGLNLVWVGNQAITIKKGSAYVNGSVLTLASDLAKTGITTSAGSWYYAYLYDNSGTPDVEFSTTAPEFYAGEASQKTGSATRRFIGCFYAVGTNQIFKFSQTVSKNEATQIFVDNGGNTGISSGSFSTVQTLALDFVPATVYKAVLINATNTISASGEVLIGISAEMDAAITYPSQSAQVSMRQKNGTASSGYFGISPCWIELTARQIKWISHVLAGSNTLTLYSTGFRIYR